MPRTPVYINLLQHSQETETTLGDSKVCADVFDMLLSHLSAGGHLDHRDVHLADVGVQATQLLKYTAAVHAWKQGYPFGLLHNNNTQKTTCTHK